MMRCEKETLGVLIQMLEVHKLYSRHHKSRMGQSSNRRCRDGRGVSKPTVYPPADTQGP